MLSEWIEAFGRRSEEELRTEKLAEAMKVLPVSDLAYMAKTGCLMHGCMDKDWLDRYVGTPMFDEAAKLEKELLQAEAAEDRTRQERTLSFRMEDKSREKIEGMHLKRRMLDIKLLEHRQKGYDDRENERSKHASVEVTKQADFQQIKELMQSKALANVNRAASAGKVPSAVLDKAKAAVTAPLKPTVSMTSLLDKAAEEKQKGMSPAARVGVATGLGSLSLGLPAALAAGYGKLPGWAVPVAVGVGGGVGSYAALRRYTGHQGSKKAAFDMTSLGRLASRNASTLIGAGVGMAGGAAVGASNGGGISGALGGATVGGIGGAAAGKGGGIALNAARAMERDGGTFGANLLRSGRASLRSDIRQGSRGLGLVAPKTPEFLNTAG